jgi:CheY-like chemotaxis protein
VSRTPEILALRVLLVDDDELVRMVVTEVLCDAGFEVTAAASPDEALSLPSGISSPSVLITDIDLGLKLTGFDVADSARQRWPDVGINLMSGFSATHTGRTSIQRTGICKSRFAMITWCGSLQT